MSEEAIQEVGSQEAVAAEAAPVSFHETLEEGLRNEPSLRAIKDVNGLAKGYVNAQRMIGADKTVIPGKSATADDWRAFYQRAGAPTEVSGYEFEGDMPLNDQYLDSFREHALNAGLSSMQANEMMGFVRNTIQNMNEVRAEGTEKARYEAEEVLRKEFGQARQQRIEMAQLAAENLLGDTEFFDTIRLEDGSMLGDNPDIVMMFSKLATAIGEDTLVGDTTELVMTPEEASRQIAEMTRRDGPYFDRMHPEHETYVQEVLRLRGYM